MVRSKWQTVMKCLLVVQWFFLLINNDLIVNLSWQRLCELTETLAHYKQYWPNCSTYFKNFKSGTHLAVCCFSPAAETFSIFANNNILQFLPSSSHCIKKFWCPNGRWCFFDFRSSIHPQLGEIYTQDTAQQHWKSRTAIRSPQSIRLFKAIFEIAGGWLDPTCLRYSTPYMDHGLRRSCTSVLLLVGAPDETARFELFLTENTGTSG